MLKNQRRIQKYGNCINDCRTLQAMSQEGNFKLLLSMQVSDNRLTYNQSIIITIILLLLLLLINI